MAESIRNEYNPDYATPPGAILEEILEDLGITKKEFAERCGLSAKHVSQVISAKAPISPDTAIRFERVLNVKASLWNNLEANFRTFEAKQKEVKELENALAWAKEFPVNELVKRGRIEKPGEKKHLVELIWSFFGVASIRAWEEQYTSLSTVFRHSSTYRSDLKALMAWLRIGELEAREVHTEPYSRTRFLEALEQIRSFTNERPQVFEPKLKELCRQAGVVVVIEPEFKKTHVSGAARWLGPEKALIQLSLRHKTNDHFWFSFFHEAGHILLHPKKQGFVDEPDGNGSKEEDQANAFAARRLIPSKDYKEFVRRGAFTEAAIRSFARSIGIAPGIAVGRLQYDNNIPYSHHNRLKVTFEFAAHKKN